MRKTILSAMLLFTMAVLFNACQKEVSQTSSNKEIIAKVNSWLEGKKPVNKPTQSANIELLKDNLDFSRLRIEQSGQNEKIVIVPVKEGLKTTKNIDKAAIPNLVLILDNAGSIRKGNIVLFLPAAGQAYNKVPDNTFHNILNTGKPDCNGKFKYLSVTGKRLHELEYQDGKLKSFGNFKDSSGNKRTSRTNFCIDWYWVYTWYDEYGNQVAQNWEYYGSTCQGEDCEDPYNAMLCPMEYGSGGGIPEGYEYTVSRSIGWDVYKSPDNGTINPYWAIRVTTYLNGRRVSGEPEGGHFTSVSAGGIICFKCGLFNVNWNLNTNWTTFGGQIAMHQVAGTFIQSGGQPVFLNEHKFYNFGTVFP